MIKNPLAALRQPLWQELLDYKDGCEGRSRPTIQRVKERESSCESFQAFSFSFIPGPLGGAKGLGCPWQLSSFIPGPLGGGLAEAKALSRDEHRLLIGIYVYIRVYLFL